MSERPHCSHLTARGRPCRNPATPGTEPPACAKHRRVTSEEVAEGRQPFLPGLEPEGQRPPPEDRPATDDGRSPGHPLSPAHQPLPSDLRPTDLLNVDPLNHFYFPRPTAAEQRVLDATAEAPDLRPEVELVRVVLRQLLVYLNESAGELPPEEVRRVAGLLFTGARTVALLLGKRPLPAAETESWMFEALRLMGERYGREL